MTLRHRFLMAPQACSGGFFRGHFGVGNDFGVFFRLVNVSWTMASLATLFVERELWIGNKRRVRRAREVVRDLGVALGAALLAHEVVRRGSRKEFFSLGGAALLGDTRKACDKHCDSDR